MLRPVQGENLEILPLLVGSVDSVVLREGVVIEELFSLSIWCQKLVGADMIIVVVYRSLIIWFFFLA